MYNPYNITENNLLSAGHTLPGLRSVFAKELRGIALDKSRYPSILSIVGGYAINMIEAYYENAGFVPMKIVDEITTQVHDAACEVFNEYEYGRHTNLKSHVLFSIYKK